MLRFEPPEYVGYILKNLTENGFSAFLVGGCVRDTVMGLPVHDWDVATSATTSEVAAIFQRTVLTGERFGTLTVIKDDHTAEVTTFRQDGRYRDCRRPDSVEFVKNIDEDLSRRDFTINAMAISARRELIDPYGGIADINNRIIRCVGNPGARFSEDALRMFRAFRFRASLGFEIEDETLSAIYVNACKAKLISAERVRVELEKTLMSQRPETVGEMIKAGLLDRYLATPGKSPEMLEAIGGLPEEQAMRWCALCALLLEGSYISSAAAFLHSLRLDGKTVSTCTCALSISGFPDDSIGLKRILSRYGIGAVRCAAGAHHCRGDYQSPVTQKTPHQQRTNRRGDYQSPANVTPETLAMVDAVIASGECFSRDKLAVSGKDLIERGYPPGRELGKMLKTLLEHVIEYPEDNKREALLEIAGDGVN